MLYKSKFLTLGTIVYSWYILMSIVYGPKWSFLLMLCIILDCLGQVCSWVELPVQRRLCPIFVRDFGSPDIHKCFRELMGSQRTPRF